jgi:hypothetical protein
MFVNYNSFKMKILLNSGFTALALIVLLTYSGCGPDPVTPSAEEVQLGKLQGTWKVKDGGNVTRDNVSKSVEYTNFTLTLSGTAGNPTFDYSTTGREIPSPWPASGKWKFGGSPETVVIRDPDSPNDTIEMMYTVTDSTLEITFTFSNATGYSRTKQVVGTWVFTLKKS